METYPITGKLVYTYSLPNSRSGNPRFLLVFLLDSGQYFDMVTRPDSSIAYSIGNYIGKEVDAEYCMHYGRRSLYSIKEKL